MLSGRGGKMAWQFRRRIRVLPGFSINLSKSGMSATIGVKGASVNIGEKGAHLNTGIPGTGVYNRKKIGGLDNNKDSKVELEQNDDDFFEIQSLSAEQLTSENLFGLKAAIIESQKEKSRLKAVYEKLKKQYHFSSFLSVFSYLLIIGFFYKKLHKIASERKNDMLQAEKDYTSYFLDIEVNMDDELKKIYDDMKSSFHQLTKIHSIWDITSSQSIDKVRERSAASASIQRTRTNFEEKSLDFLTISDQAMVLNNKNGSDYYLFPGFIVAYESSNSSFGIVDYKELNIESCKIKFIETQTIPTDTEVLGNTWKYVNKNGSPDKRFKDNYQIPIVEYYELNISNPKGISDSFQFSNVKVAEAFCVAFSNYVSTLKKLNWRKE